jgi:hypothetical protein
MHKLCKTPANQCTLTLLPFDLILGRTSLGRFETLGKLLGGITTYGMANNGDCFGVAASTAGQRAHWLAGVLQSLCSPSKWRA